MKKSGKSIKYKHIAVLLFISLVLTVLLSFFFNNPVVERLEMRALDLRFTSRGKTVPISPEIVIIAIDEKSIEALDEPFLFWHYYIAEVTEKLIAEDAKVVGIDIVQSRTVEKFKPGQLKKFQKALLSKKVVLISFFKSENNLVYPIDPIKAIAGIENIGPANVSPDDDEVIRKQALHLQPPDGKQLTCFPFLVIARYFDGELSQEKGGTYRIGKKVIKDENGYLRINYAGPANTFPEISFIDVLKKAKENDNEYFRNNFAGKIVLIGRTDPAGKDVFSTPFNVKDKKMMSGLEIHANIINTILQEQYLKPMKRSTAILIIFIFSVITVFLCFHTRVSISVLSLLLLLAVYVKLAFLLFTKYGYIVNITLTTLSIPLAFTAAMIYRYFTVDVKMSKIRDVFGKLVSDQIERELWTENIEPKPGSGGKRKVTVLFSDINDFTPICEKHTAEQVLEMLNEYFNEMIEIIFRNRGMVKQFVGDEIMVMYGVPEEEPHQAVLAVKTAFEMTERLEELEAKSEGPGFYKVKMGIHTGEIVVGFIGSEKRMEYTGIGEDVNLASRIESLNKKLETKVLISEKTYKEIQAEKQKYLDKALSGIEFKEHGKFSLKGFDKKTTVYEVRKKEE